MRKVILLVLLIALPFSQTYMAGDVISENHQNQVHETCYGDYPGGQFSLADLNGAVNGGSYYIIHIDMSATW